MALCRTMFVLVAAILCCNRVTALEPTADEHLEAQRWVAAKFEGQPQPASDRGSLLPHLKFGLPEKNIRQGHTLRIADQSFLRGIHCPSVGTIDVHLPAPGNRFTALVGVDSNDVAYYSSLGRGQVIASVEVNGKQVFRSPVMHEGLAGVPIDVDLGGATNFVLHISGNNGGTEWDQLDFADARATLTDAQQLDLSDLPIAPLGGNHTPDPRFRSYTVALTGRNY
jgi:alpha-galactosidase